MLLSTTKVSHYFWSLKKSWRRATLFIPIKTADNQGRVGYIKMRESFPIIGVWDDHDMGLDNSGKEYKNRHFQKQMYLDFL